MRTSVTCRISLLLSVLVLVVSGCTEEQTQPTELPDLTSSESGPSESAKSADEQAVIDVYKNYFETFQSLGADDEATVRAKLAPYAENEAIDRAVATLAYFRSLNQQLAGTVVFAPLEVAISGDKATVRECHDGTTELIVDSTTGAIVSRGPIEGSEAQMSRGVDGKWRLVSHDQAKVC